MISARCLLVAALAASACGGPRTGPRAPEEEEELDLGIEDVILPGEAIVARTSMDTLSGSILTAVLLDGFERQSVARVPALGKALEAVERAPLLDAREVVVTGRSLDESSAILAVAVSYENDVVWFEDFVRAFHGFQEPPGTLTGIEEGAVLGVLARDTQISWDTGLRAAVCAVRLTSRLVAYLAAPDPGECRVWASWVIARKEGDPDLRAKLDEAPEIAGGTPPLAVYMDGKEFRKLCCAPLGLSSLAQSIDEAWIGLDPGAPATVRLVAHYEAQGRAAIDRDLIAKTIDTYAPTVRALIPGLGEALDAMELEAQSQVLFVGLTVDGSTVERIADLLSTML